MEHFDPQHLNDGPVVMLVDDKTRDLTSAVLIAHHFRQRGITCHLEPLEAYRAILAAYKPSMVIINHVFASHIAAWTRRLNEMGVVVGVLLNEGIAYDERQLEYISGAVDKGAQVDVFFCWNEPHRDMVRSRGAIGDAQIVVVGVPRFDLYVQPWSKALDHRPHKRPERPLVLFCTNFVCADLYEMPRAVADNFFASVGATYIDWLDDHWAAVEAHYQGRKKVRQFLQALVSSGRYDIVLRPHPRERREFYEEVIADLELKENQRVVLDNATNITTLILECDIELSCEMCSTPLEAWISSKPTIELLFEEHPLWHRKEHSRLLPNCSAPNELPDMIAEAIDQPAQPDYERLRQQHLQKWCFTIDGKACERLASVAQDFISKRPAPDWSNLTLNDRRRAMKLNFKHWLGLPYNYDFFVGLKYAIFPKRYRSKLKVMDKSISRKDVAAAESIIARSFS